MLGSICGIITKGESGKRTLGFEGSEEAVLTGCESWMDVWQTAFGTYVVDIIPGYCEWNVNVGVLLGGVCFGILTEQYPRAI